MSGEKRCEYMRDLYGSLKECAKDGECEWREIETYEDGEPDMVLCWMLCKKERRNG